MARTIRTIKTKSKFTAEPEVPSVSPMREMPGDSDFRAGTRPTKWVVAVVLLSGFLVVTLGVGGYFFYQYRQTPTAIQTREINNLLEKLGSVIVLPEGETPTLATVTDREKLSGQAFFEKAENGDKVLIYTDSGKAILYRPATGKIVDMASINVASPRETTPTDTVSQVAGDELNTPAPASARVALYNGTTRVGVTGPAEEKLKLSLPDSTVVAKENAVRKDYTETLIVDLTGRNGERATRIAETLGGTVGTLPPGEVLPDNVDILVIVGAQ